MIIDAFVHTDYVRMWRVCVCCGCSRRRMPYVCAVDVLEDECLMCVL